MEELELVRDEIQELKRQLGGNPAAISKQDPLPSL